MTEELLKRLDKDELEMLKKFEERGLLGLGLTILAAFKAKEEGNENWLEVLRNPDLNLRIVK